MRKIFANLKSVLAAIVMVSMLSTAALSTSCSSEYDDTDIKNQLKDLTERVEALEGDFEALQTILTSAVLEAEQDADGNWVITTEDGKVNITVAGVDEGASAGAITIIEEDGVLYWAYDGEEIAPVVDEPYIRENPATGEAEISFDGKNWYSMGGYLITNVAVKDNTLVLTIGGYDVVVPMAEEIVFDIRSGMLVVDSEATASVKVKTQGIEDLSILACPKGWAAEIDGDNIVVTAPKRENTIDVYEYDYSTWEEVLVSKATAAAEGYVKVHANTADGKCLVGKLKVTVNVGVQIQVYDGKAFFTAPCSTDYGYPQYRQFFYGITTRDAYAQQIEEILALIGDYKYDNLPQGAFFTEYGADWKYPASVETTVVEMLGSEPEVGVEYVVWGFYEDYNYDNPLSPEYVSYVYYSPISVKATEDESKRTAFNVDVKVEVVGAEEYLALAVPGSQLEDYETEEEMWAVVEAYAMDMFIGNYVYPSYWGYTGKILSNTYTGSLLDICEGTQSYLGATYYTPNADYFLFVLPLDGRPVGNYVTVDEETGEQQCSALEIFHFRTAKLEAGGLINVELTPFTSYKDGDEEITLNPLNEVGVSINPTDTENWHSFYYTWLSPAELALLGTDEQIVEYLLDNTYGITPADFKSDNLSFPYYEVNDELGPDTEATIVCFFLDQNAKYGEVARCTVKTEPITYSNVALTVTSNLESILDTNILKNQTTLEVTPSTEGIVKYVYVCGNAESFTSYNYDTYEYVSLTDEDVVNRLILGQDISWSITVQEATVADLVDGKLIFSELEYNTDYRIAIVGFDADGKPTTGNFCETFSVKFQIDELKADGYEAVAPEVTYTITPNGLSFQWVVNVKPVEGTTVAIFANDPTPNGYNFPMEASDIAKVEDLFGSSNTTRYRLPDPNNYTWVENEGTYTFTQSYWYYGRSRAIVYAVCDAEGNYYAPVTIDLSDPKCLQDATAAYYGGKMQWLVSKEDMEASQLMVPAPGVIDFGVSTPNTMYVGYDLSAAYPDDPTAAGLWDLIVPQPYQFEVAGYENFAVTTDFYAYKSLTININIMSTDHFGDITKTPVTLTVDEGGNNGAGLYTLDLTNLGFWEEPIEVEKGPYYPIEFETIKSMGGSAVGGGAL